MAILAILLPVYTLLLMSVFLIIFIGLAGALLPLGHALLNRYEASGTRVTSKTVPENNEKQEAA
jgi:hypothetical protein